MGGFLFFGRGAYIFNVVNISNLTGLQIRLIMGGGEADNPRFTVRSLRGPNLTGLFKDFQIHGSL